MHTTHPIIGCLLGLALLAGCQNKDIEKTHGEEFPSEYATRSVHRFAEAQAASGARAESMLYPQHFDGLELNSLGRRKLDLMLMDDVTTDLLTVHLAMPAEEAEVRRDAVVTYLADAGVRDSDAAVQVGYNESRDNPTAPNIVRMIKIESLGTAPSSSISK